MAAFLAHEAERQVRPSTIGRRVAAIRYAHKLAGLPLPTDDQATYDNREEYGPMIDDAIQRVADEVEKILHPPTDSVVVPLRR